jgi:hypothetical protein
MIKLHKDLGSFAKKYSDDDHKSRYDAVGDALLFNGLLVSVGLDEFVPAIINSIDRDGRAFRSPRRLLERNHKNEFSRDMSLGLILGAASNQRLVHYLEAWIIFTLNNGFKSCNNASDSRGWVTPAVYTLASYVAPQYVPWYLKMLNPIAPWLSLLSVKTAPMGYPLHLIAVTCIIRNKTGRWGWITDLIAKRLYKRDPNNPLFAALAGDFDTAENLVHRYKYDRFNTEFESDGQQWAWERDSVEKAWNDSCGWDFVFIDLFITQEFKRRADK